MDDHVTKWYDDLAPGKETVRAQAYSLLRTILGSAASERPKPLMPYNPAHIRGAGNVKRAHHVRPATREELATIVEELPDRYQLMALLAAWCAMRFGELAKLRRGDIDVRNKPGQHPPRRGSGRRQVRRRLTEVRCGRPRRRHPAAPGPGREGALGEPRRLGEGRAPLPGRGRR